MTQAEKEAVLSLRQQQYSFSTIAETTRLPFGTMDRQLYGKNAAREMKTDVHEHEDHYEVDIITAEDEPDDESLLETMEIHYDVPGSARKALASAIGEIIGTYPSYQAAPSFAYIIGEYTLDRNGVLTGPRNSQLLLTLDQDGYRTK